MYLFFKINLIGGAYIFYQEVSLLAVSLPPPKESVFQVPWWSHPTENRKTKIQMAPVAISKKSC